MSTAIVLMTHRFDPSVLAEFQRLREGLEETDQVFILSDGTSPAPDSVAGFVHTFDCDRVLHRAFGVIGRHPTESDSGILRNIHLAWTDFFEAHPGFESYWLIEYDVFYAGPWKDVIETFRDTRFDLLCSHLRPRAHERVVQRRG